MSRAAQQARMEQVSTDAIRGLYADKLPPMEPTLRDLAIRAIEAAKEFSAADAGLGSVSDSEYTRLDDATYDTRRELRERFHAMGISPAMLNELVCIL